MVGSADRSRVVGPDRVAVNGEVIGFGAKI